MKIEVNQLRKSNNKNKNACSQGPVHVNLRLHLDQTIQFLIKSVYKVCVNVFVVVNNFVSVSICVTHTRVCVGAACTSNIVFLIQTGQAADEAQPFLLHSMLNNFHSCLEQGKTKPSAKLHSLNPASNC